MQYLTRFAEATSAKQSRDFCVKFRFIRIGGVAASNAIGDLSSSEVIAAICCLQVSRLTSISCDDDRLLLLCVLDESLSRAILSGTAYAISHLDVFRTISLSYITSRQCQTSQFH